MNKNIAEKIIDTIEKTGEYTVSDITYRNSYSVLNAGDNGICYFTIDEIPGWEFGMWINIRKEGNVIIKNVTDLYLFCKHELNMKLSSFTPYGSHFVAKIDSSKIDESSHVFVEMIEKIDNNRKYAFICDRANKKITNPAILRLTAMKFSAIDVIENIKEFFIYSCTGIVCNFKSAMLKKYVIINDVEVFKIDRDEIEENGLRYMVTVRFNEMTDDINEQLDMENKVVKRFFKKERYKYYGIYLDRIY